MITPFRRGDYILKQDRNLRQTPYISIKLSPKSLEWRGFDKFHTSFM